MWLRSRFCPECGGSRLVRDPENGELVCGSCGYVLVDRRLDRGTDWSAFTFEERKSLPRVGSPLNLLRHDKGLSTTFNPQEARKKEFAQRHRLWRMKKWDTRIKLQAPNARQLTNALNDLSSMGDRLNLPRNVMETASKIYRKAVQENLVRGRVIKELVAACLYMSCRRCGIIRSLDEISQAAHIHTKNLAKVYRLLFWRLNADVPRSGTRGIISRLVSRLGLRGETERIAALILDEAEKSRLTGGKSPAGIAASCIYISTRITDDRVTQEDVSREAGITEVTIRNRYKELLEEMDIVIPL